MPPAAAGVSPTIPTAKPSVRFRLNASTHPASAPHIRDRGFSPKLSADGQRVATLAQAMMQSGSRLEERAWERLLDAQVRKLLKGSHQDTVDAALDFLY